MEVVCVRHLPTSWNKDQRFQGRADISIDVDDARENQKAKQLAEQLSAINFGRVYASPLQRTLQTAEFMGFQGNVAIWDDLIEFDFGPWEGASKYDMMKLHGDKWRNDPQKLELGESLESLASRVDKVIDALRSSKHERVLMFTHGFWTRCFLSRVDALPLASVNQLTVANGEMERRTI